MICFSFLIFLRDDENVNNDGSKNNSKKNWFLMKAPEFYLFKNEY